MLLHTEALCCSSHAALSKNPPPLSDCVLNLLLREPPTHLLATAARCVLTLLLGLSLKRRQPTASPIWTDMWFPPPWMEARSKPPATTPPPPPYTDCFSVCACNPSRSAGERQESKVISQSGSGQKVSRALKNHFTPVNSSGGVCRLSWRIAVCSKTTPTSHAEEVSTSRATFIPPPPHLGKAPDPW